MQRPLLLAAMIGFSVACVLVEAAPGPFAPVLAAGSVVVAGLGFVIPGAPRWSPPAW